MASWARARRAEWTDVPLPVPSAAASTPASASASASASGSASASVSASAAAAVPFVPPAPPAEPPSEWPFASAPQDHPVALEPFEPPLVEPVPEALREPLPIEPAPVAPPAPPAEPPTSARERSGMLPKVAALVAAMAAVAAVAYYLTSRGGVTDAIGGARDRAAAIVAAPPAAVPAPPPPQSGTLRVSSTPTGARVVVDGQDRGITPLTVDGLAFGRHTVMLVSTQGTVERTVDVTPDHQAVLDESIFAGWVAVFSPIELTIAEGDRALRPDERNEIMLAAGRHDLRLMNRGLGFEEVRRIEVKPGERQRITVTPPRSSIAVTASQPADVWVDGVRLGTTPLAPAPIEIGTHDLVVRRPGGDERRQTITVTVKPFTIGVEF